MNDPSPAIADLQARWHSLLDPDRALAILPIIRVGVSQRKLASYLNCSPSLIRRLRRCLQAETKDLDLPRTCQISTNELLRRAEQNRARRDASHKEAMELKRAERIAEGIKAILRWLTSDPAAAGNAEQILVEAKRLLILAEQTGRLPKGTAPVGTKLPEIISRSRPAERTVDQVDVAWFALWLALWTFYAFPDAKVLWAGLEKALSRVQSPNWMLRLWCPENSC